MDTKKRIAKILYRSGRYGTWQPASITIPNDVKKVDEYCHEDLKKTGINYTELMIQKIEK